MLESLCIILSMSYLPFSIMILIIIIFMAPRRFKAHIALYASVFGMVSYCYNPTYEIDLSRYFYMLDYCRTLPFSQAFNWGNDGLVVNNFIFWIISKTGDNHILPLLSMGTVFGVSAYIAADSIGEECDKIWKILLFQLLFIPFYSTLSNVRNVSAFALIILAVYRDLVQCKRNIITVLLYLLPCFMHMTGFVLVLIRMSLILFDKHPIVGVMLTLGVPTTSVALYERVGGTAILPGNIGLIVSRAIWKAYASSVNSSEYAVRMREGGYFTACRIVTFIMFSILLWIALRQLKDDESRYRGFKLFCCILISITNVWILIGTVKYWIFAFAGIVSCSPILAALVKQNDPIIKLDVLIKPVMLIILIARFSLEIYYINQRINYAEYFDNFLSSSFLITMITGTTKLLLAL